MPRPVTRTRIMSAGAGAAVTVAALAFALNPPSEVDPLGTLGRASALAPAAVPQAVAPPVAFGVEGVDLAAVGYHGPDPASVTLGSLSKPFSALPTERAADIRDRIARGAPHLKSLHQAKNLLNKSLPRHDDHVRAAKRAVAEHQAAWEASAADLAVVRARAEEARADAPAEGGPDELPVTEVDPAPEGAGTPGEKRPGPADDGPAKGNGPGEPGGPATGEAPAQGDDESKRNGKDAGPDQADAKGGQGKGNGPGPDAEAPGNAGKGKDQAKDGSSGKAGKSDPGKGENPSKGTGAGKVSNASAGSSSGNAVVKVAAAPLAAPQGVQLATSRPPAEEVAQADAVLEPVAQVDTQVSPAAQVGKLVVVARAEAAVVKAEAAHTDAVTELAARRQRREAYRAATAAAEHEVWRIDAHLRWLQNELWLAQRQMPSAGSWLVNEERKDAETPIVEVRGFRVHKSLEHSVRQLVDEAAAAGIDLKGKAYRPVSRQIELRRQNCGTTEYDVYEKPSSLCSPPTAKPGRSLHEMGLALDFRNGANGITSRRDPAFQWLAKHAPSYGLYNLPAEPWHWSVTGQ